MREDINACRQRAAAHITPRQMRLAGERPAPVLAWIGRTKAALCKTAWWGW
jgi:hypothetical protein